MSASRLVAWFGGVLLIAACGAGAEDRTALDHGSARAVPAAETSIVGGVGDAPATPVPARRQELEQPTIWPAADVVFATPEEAAADFVRDVLVSGADPLLGDFRQGDARSGEIVVFSPGDNPPTTTPQERGLLALRQLGPSDGWFVIAATSEGASITTPSAGAVVAAGPLTVEGDARGFEGTVLVRAFPAGDLADLFDQVITRGGPFADTTPFSTSVDLSNATPGEVVTIVVQGDTGLGTDPADFAAIPVVVDPVIPPTR